MKALRALLARLWRGLVDDCPPELEVCENCRELHCDQRRWETCERRRAGPGRWCDLQKSCGRRP
jgi:hypothetical protein